MVLIAGLILSSFPPERIKSNPPHKMNTIEKTPANNTKSEIASNTNSQNSKVSPIIPGEAVTAACTVSSIMNE